LSSSSLPFVLLLSPLIYSALSSSCKACPRPRCVTAQSPSLGLARESALFSLSAQSAPDGFGCHGGDEYSPSHCSTDQARRSRKRVPATSSAGRLVVADSSTLLPRAHRPRARWTRCTRTLPHLKHRHEQGASLSCAHGGRERATPTPAHHRAGSRPRSRSPGHCSGR